MNAGPGEPRTAPLSRANGRHVARTIPRGGATTCEEQCEPSGTSSNAMNCLHMVSSLRPSPPRPAFVLGLGVTVAAEEVTESRTCKATITHRLASDGWLPSNATSSQGTNVSHLNQAQVGGLDVHRDLFLRTPGKGAESFE